MNEGASILALTFLGICKTRKLDSLIALVLHLIKVVLNNRELVHFFTLKVCTAASAANPSGTTGSFRLHCTVEKLKTLFIWQFQLIETFQFFGAVLMKVIISAILINFAEIGRVEGIL